MEHLGLEKMIKNASWIWKITRLHPHVRKCLFVDFAELFTVHRSETANPSFGHSSSLLVQFISEWIMIMHQHGNLDLFEIARESSVFPMQFPCETFGGGFSIHITNKSTETYHCWRDDSWQSLPSVGSQDEPWASARYCTLNPTPLGPHDYSGKLIFRLGFPTKRVMSSWWWLV